MITAKEITAQLTNSTEADRRLIDKAYDYTKEAHTGQKRKSGKPYDTHLFFVGLHLAKMGMGPNTIAAGLLHDTIEDTEITSENIRTEFGEEILFLVEGVTNLVLFGTTEPTATTKVCGSFRCH